MNPIKAINDYLLRPVRFDYITTLDELPEIGRILDVGCGNRSPVLTKKYFPNCIYHGIEKSREMLTQADLSNTDVLFELDLENANLQVIGNEWYDCVIASHVLEHLQDGLSVLRQLVDKLRHGGILYIETPSEKSVRFPSMPGTLNFYDDTTHVRVYARDVLCSAMKESGCIIVRSSVRHSLKRILLFPLHVVYSLVRYRELRGTVFWDILGFASVVIARKV